jgi:hypothetical protein
MMACDMVDDMEEKHTKKNSPWKSKKLEQASNSTQQGI